MIVDSYTAGTPSWVDLMTTDQDAAISFYADLFGWQVSKGGPETGGYAMCFKDGQSVAGIGSMPEGSDLPAAWTTYISVDDADATARAAIEAGGQVMAPVMTVEGPDGVLGRMAVLADPVGAVVGIWEPGLHRGAGLVNEPGALIWNELSSRSLDASEKWLLDVFGHEVEVQGGEMEYHVLKVGGRGVAGAMPMPDQVPPQVPSHWGVYFAVKDPDEWIGEAVAAGGTVIREPFNIGPGTMAILEDPQGAMFSIITAQQEAQHS